MNSKIKNAIKYNVSPEGIFEILLTKVQLILIECQAIDAMFGLTSPEFGSKLLHRKEWKVEAYKWFKPILISKTEEINVNDLILYANSIHNVLDINDLGYLVKLSNGKFELAASGYDKILALPEHFSPEQLQMIVDGKLNNGDELFIGCTIHDKWLKENPPFDNNKAIAYYQLEFDKHNHIKYMLTINFKLIV